MRFCICFSYEGTNYKGYQRQKGLLTVQEVLENALLKINDQKRVVVHASGRTDKGVHALCQIAHFDLDVAITASQVKRALNSNLPEDIYVKSAYLVDESFHARYVVLKKTYQYRVNIGEYQPLRRRFVYQHNYPLSIEKMREALTYLIGVHDFRAFVTENKTKENCIREITKATCEVDLSNKDEIIFTFEGKGFLRYQIRNMVGLLLKVGTLKISPSRVKEILESKDRSKNGVTAPACGLCLTDLELKEPYSYITEKDGK